LGSKLAPEGFEQARRVGKAMRFYYDDLVEKIDELRGNALWTAVCIRTTDTQRTAMTATGFLNGLLPNQQRRYRTEAENTADVANPYIGMKSLENTVTIQIGNGAQLVRAHNIRNWHIVNGQLTKSGLSEENKRKAYQNVHRAIGAYKQMVFNTAFPFLSIRTRNPSLATRIAGISKNGIMTSEKTTFFEQAVDLYNIGTAFAIDRALNMPIVPTIPEHGISELEEAQIWRIIETGEGIQRHGLSNHYHELAAYFNETDATYDMYLWLRTAVVNHRAGAPHTMFHFAASHDDILMWVLARLGFTDVAFPGFAATITLELWVNDKPANGDKYEFADYGIRLLYHNNAIRLRYDRYDDAIVPNLSRESYKPPRPGSVISMMKAHDPEGNTFLSASEFAGVLSWCPICGLSIPPSAAHPSPNKLLLEEIEKQRLIDASVEISSVYPQLPYVLPMTSTSLPKQPSLTATTTTSSSSSTSSTPAIITGMSTNAHPAGHHHQIEAGSPTCDVCGGVAMFVCSGCRKVYYCSYEHRDFGWLLHQFDCVAPYLHQ
jgi:hypothetical protein